VEWCSSVMGEGKEPVKKNHTGKDMYIAIFGRWSMYIDHSGMNAKQSRELLDSI
jgi:hypothetical protein